MSHLIIEKLFGAQNLELEVATATFEIKNKTLFVKVDFAKTGPATEKQTDTEQANGFDASDAKLELELPVPKLVENIIGNEFFIDSADEDNEELTNFYLAQTHYPTFDDTILIRQKEDGTYWLKWNGKIPDVKTSRYEMYMQMRFVFTLETPVTFLADSSL